MKVVIVLSVVALLACESTADTSPCSQVCNAECTLAAQRCNSFGLINCDHRYSVCVASCAAACQCADPCAQTCGGNLAVCKGSAKGLIGSFSCDVRFSDCEVDCKSTCLFYLYAGFVNSLLNP
ncbi:hypothetical protein PoB_004522800 [Plakobranchus ocellatus]|uniref:Uncharacterized protein n=1 Tax=Plakobranchus ocellatus TaxID=259542 RepID=A0AAV4BHR3_9GAST|nr:hypothetical protein PoB_004522800 [Plakobranchus ocellatus]